MVAASIARCPPPRVQSLTLVFVQLQRDAPAQADTPPGHVSGGWRKGERLLQSRLLWYLAAAAWYAAADDALLLVWLA